MERARRRGPGTTRHRRRLVPDEEQTSLSYNDCEHDDPCLNGSDSDLIDPEEAYFERDRMFAHQLGDLPSLRSLVDFHVTLPEESQLPPTLRPSSDQIKSFEAIFGSGSYADLDSMQVLPSDQLLSCSC